MNLSSAVIVIALAASASRVLAADVGPDVQRLQVQREQQQSELRLRMQQQQDWALRPSRDPAADFRRRQLERDQLQRQQQLFEEESRAMIAPEPATEAARAARESQQGRAGPSAAAQAQRFQWERDLEAER